MYFQVLGPLQVQDNDRFIDVVGTRRRSLLAILVLHAGKQVYVGQLIEDLWEGRPPRAAIATLHSHISALRRTLLPLHLYRQHGGYVLEAADDEVDVRVFERETVIGRAEMDKGNIPLAATTFARALDRWYGPAVADALGAEWAAAEVAHLDELRGIALDGLLDAQLLLGHHDEVVATAEAAVAKYPLRERLWAHLMVALYRSGRQAEAIRAYQRLRHHLSDELGIPPSPPLTRLEEAILLQKPELAWRSDPAAGLFPNANWALGPEARSSRTESRSWRVRFPA